MKSPSRAGALLALPAVILLADCGGKEPSSTSSEAKSAVSAPAPTPTEAGPIVIEPATNVDVKALRPGLKLTTFPNNRFSGPGETNSIVPTLGFDCEKNPYSGREASLRYEGWLNVDREGTYCIQIVADDQITFSLNGRAVVSDFTGVKEQRVGLRTGYYEVRFDYQNNVAAACLSVKWSQGACASVAPIEPARFSH